MEAGCGQQLARAAGPWGQQSEHGAGAKQQVRKRWRWSGCAVEDGGWCRSMRGRQQASGGRLASRRGFLLQSYLLAFVIEILLPILHLAQKGILVFSRCQAHESVK